MPKIFSSVSIDNEEGLFTIEGEEARYLSQVLRLQKFEKVVVCDVQEVDHTGEVLELSAERVTMKWLSHEKNTAEPLYEAVLYPCILKGEKMDWVIQKSVELGVSRIVPVISSRVISRPQEKSIPKKLERWNKIAKEAARQSGRGKIPRVEEPVSILRGLEEMKKIPGGFSFIPWEQERERSLSGYLESLKETKPGGKKLVISFLIGPEGGFSEEEIKLAQAAGVYSITLGKRILRAETASLAVLSMLSYRFERFSCIIKS